MQRFLSKKYGYSLFLGLLVAVLSLVWHFPANWLESLYVKKLPPSLTSVSLAGSWHNANGRADIQTKAGPFSILFSYDFNWLSVMKLSPQIRFYWQGDVGRGEGDIDYQWMSETMNVHFRKVELNLPMLKRLLETSWPQLQMVDLSQGQANISKSHLSYEGTPFQSFWPSMVQSDGELVGLRMLGTDFPELEVEVNGHTDQMLMSFQAKGNQTLIWSMAGKASLTPSKDFSIELDAHDGTKALPSWIKTFMQPATTGGYQLKNSGSF
ncbi:MAG: hypothetical protein RI556_10240 [Hydrogenovibrio sp.]|uniref:hypothetical protein n=1 Tax=Hydrogenovibrio sp. TaxID=2065821 RepID=UPI002870169C|nr:hypothetical protein [Hydrogenovibrio sp.]MDR9499542.1 hypothetical protein [Hydrogenovibrio sp.]